MPGVLLAARKFEPKPRIVTSVIRLLRILNTAARYRLQEFLIDIPGTFWLRLVLFPFALLNFASSHRHLNKNQRLRMALEELGPIYIKFGQLLSTRRDFLDNDLADELQALQDNVPPFSSPSIQTLVSEALDVDPSSVFSSLDEQPLASASVAQVHKAELLDGTEVVVKVLRPGIEKIVDADLKLLKRVASLIESRSPLGKRLRPVEVIHDYEKIILDELNLQAEAANTSQLRQNFQDSDQLYVPTIYWEYTRSNLLVIERIHGIPVTDVDRLQTAGIDLKTLAENGVSIFFTQVFEHNFFHADMHPGNIFVATDNPELAQYIAIDCAIIGSLTKDDQEYLAKNLLAIFKRDYRRVAELHVECGWVPEDTPVHEFESAMRTVCEPIFQKPLKEISFGQILVQLFRTAGRFNMEVQPTLVLLQKTLLNIEGLGRQLYPELDLWQTALPYLENWNSKRLNPLTILNKLQENVPNWIDQMPDLPLLIINAVTQADQLRSINNTLQKELVDKEQERKRKRANAQLAGTLTLGAGIATLFPTIAVAINNAPVLSVGLIGFGLYLLCFKE